jgi:arylsulfatase A-like enzyme
MFTQKINVLFILTDQWPAWAFSFRGADVLTPNIDKLASEGTVFTNAFTSCPLCSPARGSLLTARWQHQNGVYDNQSIGYSLQESMSLDQKTWIDEAVRLGYHVGYHGKWHLGHINPEKRGAHGFDPNVEVRSKPYDPETCDHSYQKTVDYYEKQNNDLIRGRAPFWGDSPQSKEKIQPFPTIKSGIRFLKEWAEGDQSKPFFLTVSSAPPHFPHYLPAEYVRIAEELRDHIKLPVSLKDNCEGRPWFHSTPWWGCMDTAPLNEEEWKTVIAYSHAHITLVDEAIGRILNALDHHNLTDSTTIIFTSDHGDMEGAHRRFDKGAYFYDEVWRIPLIIRTPETPPATQDAYVSILDIGETLFSLINATTDVRRDSQNTKRAGRDLIPLVGISQHPSDWHQTAYGIYHRYNGYSFEIRAIRSERYKYVWNPQDINELYDLQSDPYEMTNLADRSETAVIERVLHDQLVAWLNEVGDDLPSRLEQLPPAGVIIATGEQGP